MSRSGPLISIAVAPKGASNVLTIGIGYSARGSDMEIGGNTFGFN